MWHRHNLLLDCWSKFFLFLITALLVPIPLIILSWMEIIKQLMPCTAVNNHFLDRKQGSTYRLDCLSLIQDLVSFSALWSKACDGVNGVLLKCNKLVQSSRIQMGRQFADDGFYSCIIIKEALSSPGFFRLRLGFLGVGFLLRKVSCHLTSPIAHPASDSDPRNPPCKRTKTYVWSCLQDLLNLQPLIHKTLESSWRTTISIFLPSA